MQELKRLRNNLGWSQQRLADESGVNKATINQVEQGKRSPSIGTLESLARAMGAEVGDFFPKAQAPLWPEGPEGRYPPGEAYFVPLKEGEKEDTVTVRIYHVQLLDGDEPILQAVREASPEEAAKIRQQREKAGRTRE